jgi:SAM-dependent methyltransferase
MGALGKAETWDAGDAYEPYVGRWSRLVAGRFLDWLAVPPGKRWLDVGCGTGALTHVILQTAAPHEVVGVDPAPGFIGHAEARLTDRRARFVVGDAMKLPFPAEHFDAVVSGLVLNFVPEPASAVAEMARVARAGGSVGAYVWDCAGGMELMRYFWDAAVALDPSASDLDEGRRFAATCRADALIELLEGSGLQDVEARAIDVPTTFRDFDDYWSPFLGGQGPAPGYAVSLDKAQRVALRERVRGMLPIAADGSIALTARAWAARGAR